MSELTAEQLMIQDMARSFTRDIVRPAADRLDPVKGDIPREIIDQMGELGLFGILIGEEHGGLGLGALEYCVVAEELARGWMSVASLIARGNALIGALKSLPDDKKDAYLPRMAAGEYLGAFALSEPNAGSDVASISCRAKKVGDDYEITGAKYWCTFADGADFILVFARTDEKVDPEKRHRGISAFMVEKPRGELPQGDAMVGEEGRGFYLATAGLETARAHTAARSIGLAQAALDDAIAYSRERRQFGQAIGNFQAIRFKIADMATEIEAARALMYSVCRKIDSGVRCDREASMVKLFASEMSERVTSEAIQILGGGGYTTLNAVERHWRDARLTKIFEGTSEIQKRIISDHLIGRDI